MLKRVGLKLHPCLNLECFKGFKRFIEWSHLFLWKNTHQPDGYTSLGILHSILDRGFNTTHLRKENTFCEHPQVITEIRWRYVPGKTFLKLNNNLTWKMCHHVHVQSGVRATWSEAPEFATRSSGLWSQTAMTTRASGLFVHQDPVYRCLESEFCIFEP